MSNRMLIDSLERRLNESPSEKEGKYNVRHGGGSFQ